MIQKQSSTFYTIQALRALAVGLVVLHHGIKIVHDRLDATLLSFHLGNAGVDIFFVISGFVISLAAHAERGRRQDWRVFLRRRFLRIAPMYWLATTIKLALMIALPAMALHTGLNGWHIVASYLFIPAMNVEHQPLPVLLQGWTLSYEMFFYLCFALALAMRARPLEWLSGLFLLMAAFGLMRPPGGPAWLVLFDPLLLEFVLGLWIARMVVFGTRLGPRSATLFLAASLGLFAYSLRLTEAFCIAHRFLVWGLPAGVMVTASVMLEAPLRRFLTGIVHRMGDASYAIYLFHGFALQLAVAIILRLPLGLGGRTMLALSLGPLAALVSGLLIYRWVEVPLMQFLRRRYGAGTPPAWRTA